jgi:hypothetical protein
MKYMQHQSSTPLLQPVPNGFQLSLLREILPPTSVVDYPNIHSLTVVS